MAEISTSPPVIGFAAWSGTGKTTLLEKLIPELKARRLQLALIKHAHHDFDIDHPGKDSYKLRKAGAVDTIVASAYRWAHIHEQKSERREPVLSDLLQQIHSNPDLILVEGFKHESIPRIELSRPNLGKPLLYPDDSEIIAIATETDDKIRHSIRRLDINNPTEIVEFIINYFSL